ncbi:MAG: UbiX family flavin prenyltransferase [Bacteroidetes bacterium]|nr:MAG: UbiX family flavin prenyltransferase [Bacteroidota bacterium]
MDMHKIVVAVTGASGSVYAALLLKKLLLLRNQVSHVGLLLSKNAKAVWQHELGNTDFEAFDSSGMIKLYDKYDFSAPFASGSGQYQTMLVVPCSMGALGRIANGISDDLVSRAADVILKERRRLILAVRETPYNLIHLKNMETVTLAGGIICPCTPSFYSVPKTIEEVAATVVDRLIDLAGLKQESYRWGGDSA